MTKKKEDKEVSKEVKMKVDKEGDKMVDKDDVKKSSLADGSLPDQERGENTPLAHKLGPGAARAGQIRRGGKENKIQRLLNFQSRLCETCSFPPSRLMRETARVSCLTLKRLGVVRRRRSSSKVKTAMRGRRRGGVQDGEEKLTGPSLSLSGAGTFLPQTLTSREYKISMLWCSGEEGLGLKEGVGREEEAPEPDAGLWRCQEEGQEGWGRRRDHVGGASLLPPLTDPVSASGNNFPLTLRQVRVGDLVEGGLPGCGPEAMWVDQWTGQGGAGPLGSVYFCSSCQLEGGLGEFNWLFKIISSILNYLNKWFEWGSFSIYFLNKERQADYREQQNPHICPSQPVN